MELNSRVIRKDGVESVFVETSLVSGNVVHCTRDRLHIQHHLRRISFKLQWVLLEDSKKAKSAWLGRFFEP